MNKPTDREEQRFAQMLKTADAETPSPNAAFLEQLKAQTTEAFRTAQAEQPGGPPQPRTIPLRSRLAQPLRSHALRRLAVAASLLIASLGGLAWWSTHHAGVAFGDVVRAIDSIRSVRCTATIKGGNALPLVMKTTVLNERVRQELSGGVISIIDVPQEQILSLMTREKKAILFQVAGLADAGEENRNLLLMLRECLHRANGKAEDLGWRQIGGRQARGFRANDDGRLVTLWVDADTALPLEVELPWGDGQTTILITDYEFNPTLDESLFAMTPPPGYALLQGSLDLKDTTEQDLVSLLDLLADGNDGDFPDTLAMGSLQYDLGKAESKLSPWQQFRASLPRSGEP